jgi:hypothetical protein
MSISFQPEPSNSGVSSRVLKRAKEAAENPRRFSLEAVVKLAHGEPFDAVNFNAIHDLATRLRISQKLAQLVEEGDQGKLTEYLQSLPDGAEVFTLYAMEHPSDDMSDFIYELQEKHPRLNWALPGAPSKAGPPKG